MAPSNHPIQTYEEAVRFVEQALNYEKIRRWPYTDKALKLSRTEELLAFLGDPHRRYRIIHVAGTKGKGTTAAAAAHILSAHGHRTGLLTSPHLVTHRERIRLDGRPITEDGFVRGIRTMQDYIQRKRDEEARTGVHAPTYFEMLTALAFDFFARAGAEWALVEVGLGGRLDSTNVVSPECCVITPIGFDHMDKLGETTREIAGEKAGILKAGVPVVLGRQPYADALKALRRRSDELQCPRWEVGRQLEVVSPAPLRAPAERPDAPVGWRFGLRTPAGDYPALFTPMLGRHQLDNLAAAVGAVEMCARLEGLSIRRRRVAECLREFRMPARLELLQRSPAVLLDVAHTVESTDALLAALQTHFPGRPVRVVFGCSSSKDARGMLARFKGRCVTFTATQADMSRAMPVDETLQAARDVQVAAPEHLKAVADSREAAQDAIEGAAPGDVVCITGSFFTAGEILGERMKGEGETADKRDLR